MRVTTWIPVLVLLLLASCGEGPVSQGGPAPVPAPTSLSEPVPGSAAGTATFTGSASCRSCHERFYLLWAPSHHGTAMQPYTAELAERELTPPEEPIVIGDRSYDVVLEVGVVVEQAGDETVRRPIEHVMGGKNVFYFLTPLDRGRLQVLPVAYDVREKRWYDTTASMVRHAIGHTDEAVEWTDPLLTFNTSCWNCHVSQLSVNYDDATDTYHSEWAEPGINCETCHGPASEHVRVCEEAKGGEAPDDLKIILVSEFDAQEMNDTCAPCHAKSVALTRDFSPGDRYFDHFDLVCLEDPDFYPDGRDLGENYTFTLWRMSPCVVKGELDCNHCHTSSGRYRFATENPNGACLPCHEERVANASAHTHHPEGSAGNLCISCHMPMTDFARMRRSDHSMRPPAPSVSKEFGSPNACTICHADQDADWADGHVRAWREDDYQAPMLEAASLVADARARNWTRLDAMLAYVAREDRDEVYATSLIRLLAAVADERVGPALVAALKDPSPLVRSAAAAGLRPPPSREALFGLLRATGDDTRLVRVRAAGSLASIPPGDLPPAEKKQLADAMAELEAALGVRPDSWSSHYNLGNYHEQRGDPEQALASYLRATQLRADVVQPWVNLSMLHARTGRLKEAEEALVRALAIDDESAEAHYNLGLLLAETDRPDEAKKHLAAALEADPTLAPAAFNLAVLLLESDIDRAVDLTRRAWELRPDDTRYAHTYAYALVQAERGEEAEQVLRAMLARGRADADLYALLGQIYEKRGEKSAAKAVYLRASEDPRLPARARQAFAMQARRLR